MYIVCLYLISTMLRFVSNDDRFTDLLVSQNPELGTEICLDASCDATKARINVYVYVYVCNQNAFIRRVCCEGLRASRWGS